MVNSNGISDAASKGAAFDAQGIADRGARLAGLDFARGLALLGITFVNVELFAEPFLTITDISQPSGLSMAGQALYWFGMIFCTSKFYPLFSLLFGVGLALMLESAVRAGRSFGWTYARRLVALATFGIAHITLLWYGDVLLLYAVVGSLMLILARRSARTLFIAAGVFFAIGMLGVVGTSLLMFLSGSELPPTPPMPESSSALGQYLAIFRDYTPDRSGFDPRLAVAEARIFSEGPYVAALAVRWITYLFTLPFLLLIMGWQVAACFCFGAALLKSGFVRGERAGWRRWFVRAGLVVGLPSQVVAAWAAQGPDDPWRMMLSMTLVQVGGPLVSLMYLSVFLSVAESGRAGAVVRVIGNLGRVGLTGYLGITFLMQVMMQHWGLGWFGSVDWGARWLLVLGTWSVMLVLANAWLSRFRIGPLEWVWRSLTYLRVQPVRGAQGG